MRALVMAAENFPGLDALASENKAEEFAVGLCIGIDRFLTKAGQATGNTFIER